MRNKLEKLFYQFFRTKASLEISGIRKIFWSGEPRMYQRIIQAGGEKMQLEYFVQQIMPGDVVWDVGAFIGMYSVFASEAVGSDGSVFAFEPESRTANLVRKNCVYNNIANLEIIEAALGDINGKAIIYSSTEEQNAISSLKPGGNLDKKGIPIQIRTGDSIVAKSEAIAPMLIKMDIEGGEYQALKGMHNVLLRPECRFLLLELHPNDLPRFDSSEEKMRAFLYEVGFKIDKEILRGTEIHLFCSK